MTLIDRFKSPLLAVALASIAVGLLGCSGRRGSGDMRVQSRGAEFAVLEGDFTTAIYAENDKNVASFYLSSVPLKQLLEGQIENGQVLHIELLWTPVAGRTPLDPSAANISVRHIIVSGDHIGVYGGTGFAMMSGSMGKSRVSLSIADATLALIESSDGFHDALTPAALSGNLTAVHDPPLARKIGIAVSQIATNMLGRPRYVRAE